MAQPQQPVAVEMPTTVEVDRQKLAVLEGARLELYATQRVLAVCVEQLLKLTGGESFVVQKVAFENAPDYHAMRDKDTGEVTVSVFR